MTKKRAWSPANGPASKESHVPHAATRLYGDGSTERAREGGGLWTPSEGPVRSDPGGPGGEPDGKTISIPVAIGRDEP